MRQRLKADGKRDFTDPHMSILQEITRFLDAYAGDVIDKVHTGHLFELFAQVIGADVNELRDFRQRKLFIRKLVNELSRFPDFYRLSPIAVS